MIARRAAGGLAAAAVLALLGGCDLFATREAVVEGVQESLWTSPTSPEIVVTNLELALEIGNLNDYQRALTDEFLFRADASDVAQLALERPGEAIFEGWDREVELATASVIRETADSVAVELTKFDDDLGQTVRLLKYDYVLTVFSAGVGTEWVGEAWFEIAQQSNGEWLIRDWEDVAPVSPAESWGRLKGRSRP